MNVVANKVSFKVNFNFICKVNCISTLQRTMKQVTQERHRSDTFYKYWLGIFDLSNHAFRTNDLLSGGMILVSNSMTTCTFGHTFPRP